MTAHPEDARGPSERFTTDEWGLLADAPVLAAMMVLAAGRRGNVRGTLAVAREYAAARDRDHGPLLAELLAGPAPDVRARTRDRDALAREAPPVLRAAMTLLEREVSERDRDDYVRFVRDVAAAAARVGSGEREPALQEITAILSEDHSG